VSQAKTTTSGIYYSTAYSKIVNAFSSSVHLVLKKFLKPGPHL